MCLRWCRSTSVVLPSSRGSGEGGGSEALKLSLEGRVECGMDVFIFVFEFLGLDVSKYEKESVWSGRERDRLASIPVWRTAMASRLPDAISSCPRVGRDPHTNNSLSIHILDPRDEDLFLNLDQVPPT